MGCSRLSNVHPLEFAPWCKGAGRVQHEGMRNEGWWWRVSAPSRGALHSRRGRKGVVEVVSLQEEGAVCRDFPPMLWNNLQSVGTERGGRGTSSANPSPSGSLFCFGDVRKWPELFYESRPARWLACYLHEQHMVAYSRGCFLMAPWGSSYKERGVRKKHSLLNTWWCLALNVTFPTPVQAFERICG